MEMIPNTKKLCDYKPAYGYIFSEYLSEYKFANIVIFRLYILIQRIRSGIKKI